MKSSSRQNTFIIFLLKTKKNKWLQNLSGNQWDQVGGVSSCLNMWCLPWTQPETPALHKTLLQRKTTVRPEIYQKYFNL